MIPLRPYFSSPLLAAGVCAWSLLGAPSPGSAQDQIHDREPDRAGIVDTVKTPSPTIPSGFSEPVRLLTETGAPPVCETPAITGKPEPDPPSCHAHPSAQGGAPAATVAAPADSNAKAPAAAADSKPAETQPAAPQAPAPSPSTPASPAPAPSTPAPAPSSPKPDSASPATPAGKPAEPPRMFDGGVPPAAVGFQGKIKGCVETIGHNQSSFRMKIISAIPDSQGKAAKPESLISAVVLVMQGMDRSQDNKWTPKPGHHEWIAAAKPGDLVTVHIRYSKPFNAFRLIEVPPEPVPCDIPLPPKPTVSKPVPAPAPPASAPSDPASAQQASK